jgi:glycosyltransferase involved in cell wall biosynthesis
MPRVCIGMPVLNAEATLALTLDDLISQTYRDIEIVVCDNASDDRTAEIAEEYTRRDDRVRLVRYTDRVDILQSFQRTFLQAQTVYFMFASADDRWYPRFIEDTVAVLDARPELAACCGRIAVISKGKFQSFSPGTRPLLGSYRQRLRSYFADPAENARVFALYRREALADAFPEAWFPGWDFALIARTLAHGGQAELPRVLVERDSTPMVKYLAEHDRYYARRWGRWFPLMPVARAVLRDPATPIDPGIIWNLAVFVLRSHVTYARYRMHHWGRFITWLANVMRLDHWAICKPVPWPRSNTDNDDGGRQAQRG